MRCISRAVLARRVIGIATIACACTVSLGTAVASEAPQTEEEPVIDAASLVEPALPGATGYLLPG